MLRSFNLFVHIFIFITILSIPHALKAESISFQQAREIILSSNASIKATRSTIEAAKAGVAQASVKPNPSVGLALDNLGFNEIELSAEHTIERSNKRDLRTRAAQHQIALAENNSWLVRNELEAEILRRFLTIVTTAENIALLDSMIIIEEQTRDQIQMRVEAGAAKKTDLISIEIDLERIQLEQSKLVNQEKQARKSFSMLSFEQQLLLMNVSGEINENLAIPDPYQLQQAINNNPELKAYDIEHLQLQTEIELLKAEVQTDYGIAAGYVRNNAESSNSAIIGLSMSLPVNNKNIAAIQQVEHQTHALKAEQTNLKQSRENEIANIHANLTEIDREIETLQNKIIPKAGSAYKLIQDYYNAGNASIIDLTAAQAELLQLKQELQELKTDRANLFIDLIQLTNLDFEIIN